MKSSWSVLESVDAATAVTRSDGTVVYANELLATLTGTPVRAIVGSTMYRLFDADSREALTQLHAEALGNAAARHAGVCCATGTAAGCRARVVLRRALRPGGGFVIWSVSSAPSDEARQRAEIALRETEVRLETAMWGGDIGLWALGSDGQFRFLNDWCERFDIDHCNGPNQRARWRAQIHPDDVAHHAQIKDEFYRGGADQYDIEYRVRTRGGQWLWLLERGKVISRDRGGVAERIVGVCLDIDAHKRMEEALSDAQDRFELAINAARLPVWEYDVAADTVRGNVHWHRTVGYELNDIEAANRTESWMSDIHPDDAAQCAALLAGRQTDPTGFFQNEFRIKLRTGEYRWLLDRARVVKRDAQGKPLKVVGISVDIQSQKELQASLRASQVKLETAIIGADLGLWDWNVETGEVAWLSDWPTRFAIDVRAGTTMRQDWVARIHPEDRTDLTSDGLIGGANDEAEREYRVATAEGVYRWVHVRAKVLERDSGGRARRIVGAYIDVDVRRRAEEVLRTQAKILETMGEGVALIDLEGRMELFNPAFQRMFRGSTADLLGASIADLLTDGQSQPIGVEQLIVRWLNQARTRTAVFRRRDGTEFTAEVAMAPISLAAGRRWLAVVQDVSERERLEQEVLDISNRERRRIGHDLHDGLCQELTGVALMLHSVATNLERGNPPTPRQIVEIVALVNSAIDGARAMARGLSPITIDRGGLLTALEVLVRRARESSGIPIRLQVRLPAKWTIPEGNASHLYRIAQEALNNAVRHAGARSISVALQALDDHLELSISDNGRGLPAGSTEAAGMGLKIMDYRARMIGGRIDITPRRGGGTRVRCVCSAPAREGANSMAG